VKLARQLPALAATARRRGDGGGPDGLGALRRLRARRLERWAWPAALAAAGIAWYASDSLRHRREGAFGYELDAELDVRAPEFRHAAEALTGAPITEGNEVELLINGERIFPALLETIASARRTLNLETYVYWRGAITREVSEAVCARSRAGVRCNVILDALGSAIMDRDQVRAMEEAGARVVRFRPVKPYTLRRLANRTHRRVLVADGEVGMTGGVGIAAEWTGDAEDPDHWRDTHVRVRGPAVRGLQGAFAEHWLEATGEVLGGAEYLPDLGRRDGGGACAVVRSKSGVGDTNVEALYYLAIAAARRSLDLTAAYFAPRPAFTGALAEAARRGVRVRILVPGEHIDKQLVRVAGRAAYSELLAAGVEIHEYGPTMLHAKTLAVDDAFCSVGTVNFDNRSFQLHDEITLCVWSERFAALLREQFERDLERSERIEPSRWARRAPWLRAQESATKLLRREL
jgi:cardiolipin synthase